MKKTSYLSSCGKTEDGADFVVLSDVPYFSASQTFDCGQCFRFNAKDGGVEGVAFGRFIRIEQDGTNIKLIGVSEKEYEDIFAAFLGLDEDYESIRSDIGEHFDAYDDIIYEAMNVADGIRILRQEPWEALASFIISQNNNIPRIKKIIENISAGLGEAFVGFDGKTHYAFPTAEAIIKAGETGLAPFKMGFRTRYLLDAAKKYIDGEVDFARVESSCASDAEKELMQICGVGKKVADCTLLFGFHKLEFFPVDVWIKRVLEKYYPNGIDLGALGAYAGVAQQYLFYHERYIAAKSGRKEDEK